MSHCGETESTVRTTEPAGLSARVGSPAETRIYTGFPPRARIGEGATTDREAGHPGPRTDGMTHEPATYTTTERTLGRLPSGADVSVTVHRYEGGDGPTVYLQAAQHGIELNGPATLRRLHEEFLGADLAGTVLAVPVANPPAFDHRSYGAPPEFDVVNPNMNRVWPGDETGTFQERLAAELWGLVSAADAIVDLHTGTADMLEHVRVTEGDTDARRLATVFGTEYLLVDDPEDTPGGKLRTAAAEGDVPAIAVELSNSRQVSHDAVDAGVRGVRNLLRELGVLAGNPESPPEQTVLRDDADRTAAHESGLFEVRPGVGVGDFLEGGEKLGTIYCPSSFQRLQTVTVAENGVAYSLTREGVVVAGERLAAVGRPVE